MALIRVTGMPLEPHNCVTCGKGPQTTAGEIRDCIFAEAVDINWGDSVYVCPDCIAQMAHLFGYITPEEAEKRDKKINKLKGIERSYEELNETVRKIIEGNQAKKEVQDASDH